MKLLPYCDLPTKKFNLLGPTCFPSSVFFNLASVELWDIRGHSVVRTMLHRVHGVVHFLLRRSESRRARRRGSRTGHTIRTTYCDPSSAGCIFGNILGYDFLAVINSATVVTYQVPEQESQGINLPNFFCWIDVYIGAG
ncbi:hypothetical protein PLEOSDRAFT_1071462 [Pleurotus ostreatus PC15]|uniref:Uncharacterized protein n=1 Tax=Pleurotus ostreatus (strain PC15) TaxID=1137138 RepID=A0A067NX97_PLEO1|nr:hypothetical protein PLEOSDRAFT_1071462 [Pleurotus ostreatus PC15]